MLLRLFLFNVTLLICTGHEASGSENTPIVQKTYFHLIAPGTIQSNFDYPISISITASQSHKMWWFWMVLWAKKSDEIYTSASADGIKGYPGTTTLSRLSNTNLHHREGRISMSHNGSCYTVTPLGSLINIEIRNYSAYIQTDKGKYRPGEVVQFRVIFLDRFTRPVNVTNDDIFVRFYDGLGNLIKEFSNVVSVQGVHKGYLQISDHPALGEWNIDVKSGSHSLQRKSFQVGRYSQPKYTFNFTTNTKVGINEVIRYSYGAKYPDASVVQGNFTIQFNVTYCAVNPYFKNYTLEGYFYRMNERITMADDFNITEVSGKEQPLILAKLLAVASARDRLYGFLREIRHEVIVYSNEYRIRIDVPRTFDPEKLVKITVHIDAFGLYKLNRQKVKVRVEGIVFANGSRARVTRTRFLEMFSPEPSFVVPVDLRDDHGWREYKVYAEYSGYKAESQTFRKRGDTVFKLNVLTKRPEVGKELVVQLRSNHPIENFVYHIMSPVDILEFGHVNVAGDARTYFLSIKTCYVMVPKITLYVHRIQNGVLHSALKEISIKRVFYNSIQIDIENTNNRQMAIHVTTNEGSYVGLMAIREDQLQMDNKHPDLTEENFFTALNNYDEMNAGRKKYPASEAGILVFTNAGNKVGSVLTDEKNKIKDQPLPARINKPTFQLPAIQDVYSETWMFKDIESTPAGGLSMLETIPNPGPSWVLTGFSLNPITGLTFTKKPTKFKPQTRIFVELPNLVRKGEIIEVPIYVVYDGSGSMSVPVIVETSGLQVESLEHQDLSINTMKTIEKVIRSGKTKMFEFLIRCQEIGLFNVTARTMFHGSVIKQMTITVIPEGISTTYSRRYWRSIIKHGSEGSASGSFQDVMLEMPENAIDGSVTLHMTVVRDVFKLLSRRLVEQVKIPTGNCKDTLRYMMANVLILKYMNVHNRSNSKLSSRVKLNLEQAFQNLMAFRRSDGSFSLFNQNAIKPDIWLTTFALWVLDEVSHFIVVDSSIIQQGFNSLYRNQIQSKYFFSGTGAKDNILFTAFAVVSILRNETRRQNINETVAYLQKVQNTVEDSLSSVMLTYAMALGGNATSKDVPDQLTDIIQASKTKTEVSLERDSLQAELEATADCFVSLLEDRTNHTLLPVVKALISVEQDDRIPNYLLALDAMITISGDTKYLDQNFRLNFSVGGSYREVHVTHTTRTIKLSPTAEQLRLSYKGIGFGIVDFRWKYRIHSQNQSLTSFKTNVTYDDPAVHRYILNICTARKSPSTKGILSRIEVDLQSGFAFDEDSFEAALQMNSQIRSIQLNGHYGSLLVYVEDIFETGSCIQLHCVRHWKVYEAKPGSITVFDAEKEDDKSIFFFHIPDKTSLH